MSSSDYPSSVPSSWWSSHEYTPSSHKSTPPRHILWSLKNLSYKDFYRHIPSLWTRYKKYLLYGVAGFFVLYGIWVYAAVYSQLPVLTADGLRDMTFSQTSTITSKQWTSLYKFYEQNREYIDYDAISPMAVNAFVAIEDQSFRQNDGVDLGGIARAFLSTLGNVIGLWGRAWWANSISTNTTMVLSC